ncbi:MAG: helix-turn-helix domain-containing protein [Oscillospiraceae bacterium]|nr:helix-turn-helix domain-containing protein [Oscillospiraceae bacterium]
MTLGEKLRAARLEAGITQRQLCGDTITRNMLSQIENGSAKPSMQTLQYLAKQLGRPMSWFLEEDGAISPNLQVILAAREAYGDWEKSRQILQSYREPDILLDPEYRLLLQETLLSLAEEAANRGKKPYALSLLAQAEESRGFYDWHRRRRLLLRLRLQPEEATLAQLPSLDEELLLRAEAARESGDLTRSQALLESMENRATPRWAAAMGQVQFDRQEYAAAAKWFMEAEEAFPEQIIPRLERCFEAMGDYKLAYHYACKQREKER